MKLSEFGNDLWEEMKKNFECAVRKLNTNKMDGVVGYSFTEVIKSPYDTYKPPKSLDAVPVTTRSSKSTDRQSSDETDQE